LHFMDSPGYDPELDLAAVSTSGQFGAFAMAWIDPISQTGQFEPVGTDPRVRRMGLARATLLEGLRRLQARGMKRAIVMTDTGEEAAVALYKSIGFKPMWKLYLYGKNMDLQ
jgi:mycothiol synthase